jgi:hypothetical protein
MQIESLPQYAPLASVWEGDDAELLERLLTFYPLNAPRESSMLQ